MSKILKSADYKEENPFILSNRNKSTLIQEKLDKSTDKVKLPSLKFKQDAADRLLEDALTKAKDIINDAEDKAQNIVIGAENQKENIEKDAFEKGYHKGYNDGLKTGEKKGLSKWENSLEQFNTLREELQDQNNAFKDYLEKECIKLSLLITEKVLGEKIKEDAETFLKLIKKALRSVAKENDVVIRVSEADFERIDKQNLKLKGIKNKISFIKDPTLGTGDCIIENNSFKLDAGIKTQLKYIKSTLKELDVICDE